MQKNLTLLLVLFSLLAKAQNQPLADSTQQLHLDELVVSALRSPKPRFNTPEAIHTLWQDAFDRQQMRTTPEALAMTPGILVQKTNHGGGSPFLRGLTGNQTLLLIDGIRLSNATFRYGPNQYFNTIDLFSVQNIEVLAGSGSVQYGSDALGGTIQAFTPNLHFADKSTWTGNVALRGASQGMEKSMRIQQGFSARRIAVEAGLSLRRFGDLVGGDTTGLQSPNAYRELDFDGKMKLALSRQTNLTIAHQTVQQDDVPVYHKIKLENFAINKFDQQQRILSYARLEHLWRKGIWKQMTFTLSQQNTVEVRESQKNGSATNRIEKDRVRSTGVVAQLQTDRGAWSAVHGAEMYYDRVGSLRTDQNTSTGTADPKRGLYPDGSEMSNLALFSLHEWDASKWHFTAGLRWNYFKITVEDEQIGKAVLRPAALVHNAAVMYKIRQHSNVFVSYGTGFRAPNIDDLGTLGIVDFRYETPNYKLKPEHSTQIQVGYKFNKPKTKGELYLYRTELRDLIARVRLDTQKIQGYPLHQKENTERAYIQGIESTWTHHFNNHWQANSSITYTYGQNLTRREPMRRIPPLFGRISLEFSPSNWSFSAECLFAAKQDRLAQGDKDDNRITATGTNGWQVLNIHTGYSRNNWGIQINALNLFNQDYRTHGSGVNGVGRSMWATLVLKW